MSKNDTVETQFSEEQIIRLGRTLRRFSRTSQELMRVLGIPEDAVKISRKKKRTHPPSRSREAAE